MITSIIKFLFIFLCCILIYQKLLNTLKISLLYNCALSFLLSVITYICSKYSEWLNYIVALLLLWLIISILSLQPQKTFVAISLSFTISLCIHMIVSFVAVLLIPFFRIANHYPLLALVTGVIQLILTKCLFSIKRFRKGMPFLSSTKLLNLTTFLCACVIGFTIYISLDYLHFYIQPIALFCFIIALTFLIFWWQAQITKAYLRNIELREQESKRIADLEKDIFIQKILQDNDRLSMMSHRDNTLLTTLANSSCDYLEREYVDWIADAELRKSMVADIRKLQASRTNASDDYNETAGKNFQTGLSFLNQILHQHDSEATKNGISFSVHVGTALDEFVPSIIPEMDLVHLVDDLLKNAFKATRNSESRLVRLQFYKVGKHFVVEVADSGIPFEVESLVLLGLEKRTTYEDGSGIGLVDIWNTKENLRATYHIEEYDTPAPFTKKISLTFDGKNRYSIRTSRKDEILKISKRVDLQVYDF